MAYRDGDRPQCPTCEVALEPREIPRAVDVNVQPQATSKFLTPRPPAPLAPWTEWSCASCGGALLDDDHLAARIDAAAGDVRRFGRRYRTAAQPTSAATRCEPTGRVEPVVVNRAARIRSRCEAAATGLMPHRRLKILRVCAIRASGRASRRGRRTGARAASADPRSATTAHASGSVITVSERCGILSRSTAWQLPRVAFARIVLSSSI